MKCAPIETCFQCPFFKIIEPKKWNDYAKKYCKKARRMLNSTVPELNAFCPLPDMPRLLEATKEGA